MKNRPYSSLAFYYDRLTTDIDYPAISDTFFSLCRRHGISQGIGLDLGCGTGNLTLEMAKKGFDMIGVDASAEMLSVATEKCAASGKNILLLNQSMENLDLYGTVNAVFCSLDGINHLLTKTSLEKAFSNVGLFLEKGGVFVFDLITLNRFIRLNGEACIRDEEKVFCSYRYFFEEAKPMLYIDLDLFSQTGKTWYRETEQICERPWSIEDIDLALETAGLQRTEITSDFSLDPYDPDDERITVTAIKTK